MSFVCSSNSMKGRIVCSMPSFLELSTLSCLAHPGSQTQGKRRPPRNRIWHIPLQDVHIMFHVTCSCNGAQNLWRHQLKSCFPEQASGSLRTTDPERRFFCDEEGFVTKAFEVNNCDWTLNLSLKRGRALQHFKYGAPISSGSPRIWTQCASIWAKCYLFE